MDSTLISRKPARSDVTVYEIPATKLASDNGIPTLANMIIVGKILHVLGQFDEGDVEAALKKVISAKHADMMEANLRALQLGTQA